MPGVRTTIVLSPNDLLRIKNIAKKLDVRQKDVFTLLINTHLLGLETALGLTGEPSEIAFRQLKQFEINEKLEEISRLVAEIV